MTEQCFIIPCTQLIKVDQIKEYLSFLVVFESRSDHYAEFPTYLNNRLHYQFRSTYNAFEKIHPRQIWIYDYLRFLGSLDRYTENLPQRLRVKFNARDIQKTDFNLQHKHIRSGMTKKQKLEFLYEQVKMYSMEEIVINYKLSSYLKQKGLTEEDEYYQILAAWIDELNKKDGIGFEEYIDQWFHKIMEEMY